MTVVVEQESLVLSRLPELMAELLGILESRVEILEKNKKNQL